jgi:hypothetical protein
LSEAFEFAGEMVQSTLSAVYLHLAQDVHYDDLELELSIYGKDGPGSAPILNEVITDVDELLVTPGSDGAIAASPRKVMEIFSGDVRRLLADRGIKITWNHGWRTEVAIDPLSPDNDGRLLPEER